jgi:hypothetical protein
MSDSENTYPDYGFLHIPKTAGGSLVNELIKTNWIVLGHDEKSPHFMHLKDFRENHPKKGIVFITAVRNPLDRLVSSYHYLMAGGNSEQDRIDGENLMKPYKNFEDFVLKRFGIFRRNKTLNQIHLRPQNYWCYDNNKLLVNKVFKFEELNRLFNYVTEHSVIKNSNIGHVHKSNHKPYNEYYSSKMESLVRKVYQKDFSLFDY